MHRSHRVRDLIQYEVNFTLDLMTFRDATYQLLHDLRVYTTFPQLQHCHGLFRASDRRPICNILYCDII